MCIESIIIIICLMIVILIFLLSLIFFTINTMNLNTIQPNWFEQEKLGRYVVGLFLSFPYSTSLQEKKVNTIVSISLLY